jgi:hypothetical protein
MFDFDELLEQDPPADRQDESDGGECCPESQGGATAGATATEAEAAAAPLSPLEYLEHLREQCRREGFCVDWCGEPGPMETLLGNLGWQGYGINGLKEELKNLHIPFGGQAPFLQSKFMGEVQPQTLAERERIVTRIKTVLEWKAMSLQQLREECDRRQVRYPLAQSCRGEDLQDDIVQRLVEHSYGLMWKPFVGVDELPAWSGPPWQPPATPSPKRHGVGAGVEHSWTVGGRMVPIIRGPNGARCKDDDDEQGTEGDGPLPPRPFPSLPGKVGEGSARPLAAMGGAETAAGEKDSPEEFFAKFFGACLAMSFDSRRPKEPLPGPWTTGPAAKERVQMPKHLIWKNRTK